MNKFVGFWTTVVLVFAYYLAYIGSTWYSVFALCLSFIGMALLVNANEPKKDYDTDR